jgi:hypothetical protein
MKLLSDRIGMCNRSQNAGSAGEAGLNEASQALRKPATSRSANSLIFFLWLLAELLQCQKLRLAAPGHVLLRKFRSSLS